MTDLRQFSDLEIDWYMEPADAVALYLEWGNSGYGGSYENRVKSVDDHTYYFMVYNWKEGLKILFIRRDSAGTQELAELTLPPAMEQRFQEEVGHNHGAYPLTDEIRQWLKKQLYE